MQDELTVTVETEGSVCSLRAPYYPDFPARARELGGRRQGDVWVFDSRDNRRVRALAKEIYGTDGTSGSTVDLRFAIDAFRDDLRSQPGPETLWLFGRRVVARPARDSLVEFGPRVVVFEGGFQRSGGSVKNPALEAQPGTVLEVRDVPAGHPHLREYADRINIVAESNPIAGDTLDKIISDMRFEAEQAANGGQLSLSQQLDHYADRLVDLEKDGEKS